MIIIVRYQPKGKIMFVISETRGTGTNFIADVTRTTDNKLIGQITVIDGDDDEAFDGYYVYGPTNTKLYVGGVFTELEHVVNMLNSALM